MTTLKQRALELLPEGTDPEIIHKVTAHVDGLTVQLVTGSEITLKAPAAPEVETEPGSRRLGSAAAAEERRQRIAAATTPAGRGDEATGQNEGLDDVPTIFPEVAAAEVDYDAITEDDIEEVTGLTAAKAAAGGDERPSTVKDLRAALDAAGVDYPAKARKADLEKLYDRTIG